jgi:hypothetical protein
LFINNGTVEIQSGSWQLIGNGSATGTFMVDSGATFYRNTYYSGGTITGPGTLKPISGSNLAPAVFTGGDIPTLSGSYFVVPRAETVSSLNMTGGFLIVRAAGRVGSCRFYKAPLASAIEWQASVSASVKSTYACKPNSFGARWPATPR